LGTGEEHGNWTTILEPRKKTIEKAGGGSIRGGKFVEALATPCRGLTGGGRVLKLQGSRGHFAGPKKKEKKNMLGKESSDSQGQKEDGGHEVR